MLGKNHGTCGLIAYGLALYGGERVLQLHRPSVPELVIGGVVAVGAALAPDLDESGSISGRANPLSKLPIYGGHRTRTHCLLTVAAMAVAAIWCARYPDATGVLAGLLATMGASWVLRKTHRGSGMLTCLAGGAVLGYVASLADGGWWLIAAVPLPYLSHLVGDALTPGGVPFLMPFTSKDWTLGLFYTGKTFEKIVMTPLCLLAAGASLWLGVAR